MTGRIASCRCGQLRATVTGEPVRVSVCHCLNCKKRSGSAFSVQARWPAEQVKIEGRQKSFTIIGDSGGRGTFSFCPDCGSDVYYEIDAMPGVVAIPAGAFDDPFFVQPKFSVYEERKHDWVEVLGEDVERFD
jgi:hypothetical protein